MTIFTVAFQALDATPHNLLIQRFSFSFQNEMDRSKAGGFEPSADELIEVLKNLENLAAANPPLYKAIVEQIKSECSLEY
jgi:hypothetical protein